MLRQVLAMARAGESHRRIAERQLAELRLAAADRLLPGRSSFRKLSRAAEQAAKLSRGSGGKAAAGGML